MTARAFDLVVFDLDGTLIETASEIFDAVNDTMHEHGLPRVREQQVRDWIGHGTHATLLKALAWAQSTTVDQLRDRADTALIVKRFDQHYLRRCGTRSRVYDHVESTLAAMRAKGTRLALVTNKESRYTERILMEHRLLLSFDRVICGDTVASKKPDPAGVLACMAEFNASPRRTLYVGDSAIDALTARRAGISVWLVPYGYNGGDPVADCQPDRVISDISEVIGESVTL